MKVLSRRRYRQIGSQIMRNRFPEMQITRPNNGIRRDEINQNNILDDGDDEEEELNQNNIPDDIYDEEEMWAQEDGPNLFDITNNSDEINLNNIQDSAELDDGEILAPEDSNDDFVEDEWYSNKVRDFCLRWRLRTRCVRELLSVFHLFGITVLPKSGEALMGTPLSKIHLKVVEPGHYHHIGLSTIAKHLPSKVEISGDTTFKVAYHIDGISFANASSVQGWTILGKLVEVPDLMPFLVGVYVGSGVPKDFDLLLEDLGNDIVQGRTVGFEMKNEIMVQFHHAYTICDSPARSKVTHTMGPSAKKGCFDCCQIGETSRGRSAVQYASKIVYPLRTDEAFKARLDPGHHHPTHQDKMGLLESIGFNMTTDFPICAMHTVDLGIMKKILSIIIVEKGFGNYKFKNHELTDLSAAFVSLRDRKVLEMARYPRDLIANSKHLKATECRGLLLYYGLVLFKPFLKQEMYEHFVSISLGIRVLADPSANSHGKEIAQRLLESFVEKFTQFYGPRRSFVVHMILHIKKYVDIYGPLYGFSAYEFENHLRDVKYDVHFHHKVIEQLKRRATERGFLKTKEKRKEGVSRPGNDGSFSQFATKSVVYRCDGINSFAWIKEQGSLMPVMLEKFIKRDDVIFVHFKKLTACDEPFFTINLSDSEIITSEMFNISYCKNHVEQVIYETNMNAIAFKGMALPFEDNIVLIPLLHED